MGRTQGQGDRVLFQLSDACAGQALPGSSLTELLHCVDHVLLKFIQGT